MKITQIFVKKEKKRTDNSSYYEYVFLNTIPQRDSSDLAIDTLYDVINEIIIFFSITGCNTIDQIMDIGFYTDKISIGGTRDKWYSMQTETWYKGSKEYLIARENFIEIYTAWENYMVALPNYIIITREDNHYSITFADNLDAFETTKK